MLCRIKCQIFINLPNEFAVWRGHYENDEYKKRMQSTTFWSQLVIARKLWMNKCKALGLPENKSLQDILMWCEIPQNQVVDNETKTKRPRWSDTDNGKWRKEVIANLSPNINANTRGYCLTVVQKSEAVWSTLKSFVQSVDRQDPRCLIAMLVSTADQSDLLLILAFVALLVSDVVSCRGDVMWYIKQDDEVKNHREGKNLGSVRASAWNSKLLRPHFEKVLTGNSDKIVARFFEQIRSNSGHWKTSAQVHEHIANNSKRFMVQVHLAALTGCEEGIEQFQNDYREVLRLHSIDAYEQYISANDKKPPKQIKALADDLMNALKMHKKR